MPSRALQQLTEHGQSIWLDYIDHDLVSSGELARLVDDVHVSGLTSNPTIFERALSAGTAYDRAMHDLLAEGVASPDEIFTRLAVADIQGAADVLRPLHEASEGCDGFVSLELPPALAGDTEATVREAGLLAARVDRPNLMVKVPATPAGVDAVRLLVARGVNVNVTLIFALSVYARVIDAYISGLEDRRASGLPLDVHSVASFFVSRVDTTVDRALRARLAGEPGDATLESLLGTAAIANARLAYHLFHQSFLESARFDPLRAAGGRVQRPLWASTSAKDPNYRDVVYAEQLIGPHTVDTMPPQTLSAFDDHGVVAGDTVTHDVAAARSVFDTLASHGIDMEEVGASLLEAGLRAFAESYDHVVQVIAGKASVLDGAVRAGATIPPAAPRG